MFDVMAAKNAGLTAIGVTWGMSNSEQIAKHQPDIIRTILELFAVSVGYLLGGPVGVGTIIFSLTIGWTSEVFLNLFNWCGKRNWFVVTESKNCKSVKAP